MDTRRVSNPHALRVGWDGAQALAHALQQPVCVVETVTALTNIHSHTHARAHTHTHTDTHTHTHTHTHTRTHTHTHTHPAIDPCIDSPTHPPQMKDRTTTLHERIRYCVCVCVCVACVCVCVCVCLRARARVSAFVCAYIVIAMV